MQYLEILFRNEIHEIDLDIIKPASMEAPGLARLNQAQLKPNGVPHVQDVVSWTGPKIGFVFEFEEPIGPFLDTYQLIEADTTSPERVIE